GLRRLLGRPDPRRAQPSPDLLIGVLDLLALRLAELRHHPLAGLPAGAVDQFLLKLLLRQVSTRLTARQVDAELRRFIPVKRLLQDHPPELRVLGQLPRKGALREHILADAAEPSDPGERRADA